jgi:hypothetical protein
MLWGERHGPVPMLVAVVARTTADSMKRRKE